MKIKTPARESSRYLFRLPVGSQVNTVATLALGVQGSPAKTHDYYLHKLSGTAPELLWLKTKGRSLHDQQGHVAK